MSHLKKDLSFCRENLPRACSFGVVESDPMVWMHSHVSLSDATAAVTSPCGNGSDGDKVKFQGVGISVQLSWCQFCQNLVDLLFLAAVGGIIINMSHTCTSKLFGSCLGIVKDFG